MLDFCPYFRACGKIYTLSDEGGNVFYVGCTTRPIITRYSAHINCAKYGRKWNKEKSDIIRSLNYKVNLSIVQAIWIIGRNRREATRTLLALEKKWIEHYLNAGHKLTNKHSRPRIVSKSEAQNRVSE